MSEKPRIGSLVKYADELRHPLPWVGVVVSLDNPYYEQSVHTSVGVKWAEFPAVVEEWVHELEIISEGR
jgi:uridine phosphorylase